MDGLSLTSGDKLVIGLVGVAIGTGMFRQAARKLGWQPIAITMALYIAGRAADLW
jgi:hypothetical protein